MDAPEFYKAHLDPDARARQARELNRTIVMRQINQLHGTICSLNEQKAIIDNALAKALKDLAAFDEELDQINKASLLAQQPGEKR